MDRNHPDAIDRTIDELGLPVVVKPEQEGSSIGLSIARTEDQLKTSLEQGWKYDRRCMVEGFIEGVEITCGVLGNDQLQALPLIEIIPGEGYEFFDYVAKYTPGASREICPARVSSEITRQAQEYAIKAHRALHCRGYSRTDMIVRGDEIFLLETNTIPGMTQTSLFPQAAAAAGISFPALLDRLIGLALEK
jgi:D-alanine-D-alanine ligase